MAPNTMNDTNTATKTPSPIFAQVRQDIVDDVTGCLYWYQRPFASCLVGDPDKVDPNPVNAEPSRFMKALLTAAAAAE